MKGAMKKAYDALPIGSPVRVYMRIVLAAQEGKGVVLSADEAFTCSLDSAVEMAVDSWVEGFLDEEAP